MNQQAFKRYIWLIDTVYQSGEQGITFEEINQAWQNSTLSRGDKYPLRTFHNHRKEIRDVFQVDIYCKKSLNRYFIEEKSGEVVPMRKLLELMTIGQLLDAYPAVATRLNLEQCVSGGEILSKVLPAIVQHRFLTFTYLSLENGKGKMYEQFAPYAVKEFEGVWYILGRHNDKSVELVDARLVKNLLMSPDVFDAPDDKQVSMLLNENYGRCVEDIDTEQITIKVQAALAAHLRMTPLHISQMELERKRSYSIFYFHLKPTEDFCRKILSLHGELEVMNPVSVKERIAKEAKKVARKNS